jgi:8-oxo-dGTP diphosphatase
MARTPIYAAGGIVVRGRARPLIAVVQRSKDERWVLPRGKLKRDENPMAGARREVIEETGHRVRVHEFLGAITYRVRGRAKLVQFWRMQAYEKPSRDIMSDIAAVEWLPLRAAVRRLSYPLERLFLQHVGRRILKRRKPSALHKAHAQRKPRNAKGRTAKVRGKNAAVHSRSWIARLRRSRRRPHTHGVPVRIAAAKQTASRPAGRSRKGVLRRMLGRG